MNGKPLPFEKPKLERTKTGNLLASPWKFAKHGQCGTEVSELLPHLATHVDDLCVIRSMVADNINHTGAALQMNTGEQAFSRPSLGSWLVYGLGTENQNLPGFVVVSPAAVFQGAQLWSSSFLPSAYQGTLGPRPRTTRSPTSPIPSAILDRQRDKLDALGRLNELHKRDRVIDSQLDARIASFELAFRMQRDAPGGLRHRARERRDANASTGSATRRPTCSAGSACWPGGWSNGACGSSSSSTPRRTTPGTITAASARTCPSAAPAVDRPIAGLLHDLKARGLLDDTLVLWGGEFGRTPTAEGTNGRDHHPFGFTHVAGRRRRATAAWSTGPPTNSAGTPSKTRSTSTTCTRRSCT